MSAVLGEWHSYHFSRANYVPILRVDKWKIERSFPFGIQITTHAEGMETLCYKGRVSFESGYVLFSMNGVNHPEQIQYRLTAPIPNKDTIMTGFSIGIDFDHEIYAGYKLLSQKFRSDEEAMKTIREAVDYSQAESCLRFSKKPIPIPEINN